MSGARRRVPVEPDESSRLLYEAALAAGSPFELTAWPVTGYPPKGERGNWRVLYETSAGRGELSGGRSLSQLHAAVLEAAEIVRRSSEPLSRRPVADFIDDYLTQMRARGWVQRTYQDRRSDLAGLRGLTDGVTVADLDVQHLRAAVQQAGTMSRGDFLAGRYAHLLAWGRRHDYIRADQMEMCDAVEWTAPDGYEKPEPLKKQARQAGSSKDAVPRGDVLTFDQLNDWAAACGRMDPHGEGLIHTFAALGLRYGEGIALTADARVADRGLGNHVDLDRWEVHVRWQTSERGGRRAGLPKAKKIRDVVIPADDRNPAGFHLRLWLRRRAASALAEQAEGTNPLALLFPSPEGGVWWHSNLRQKVWQPALASFSGTWATVFEVKHANGRTRHHQKFTLHSLRDRYACTAVDKWKYTKAELFEQGGWEDMATVNRYYYGVTDDTHGDVRKKLARPASCRDVPLSLGRGHRGRAGARRGGPGRRP